MVTDEHVLLSTCTIVLLRLMSGEHVLMSKYTIYSLRWWLMSTFSWVSPRFNHSDGDWWTRSGEYVHDCI